MSPHLPYAYNDDDEFLHPVDGWLLLDRAITYDSWISWRHALPSDRQGRNAMTSSVSDAIAAVAEAIHELHQRMPGYQRLDRSPFAFPRWWDPRADDEWQTGRCCLFRLEGSRSRDLLEQWSPARSAINLVAVSDSHLEAALISSHPGVPQGGPPGGGRPRGRGGSRRRQSPPPQTDDCLQPAPTPGP